jgi:hypothetical protein
MLSLQTPEIINPIFRQQLTPQNNKIKFSIFISQQCCLPYIGKRPVSKHVNKVWQAVSGRQQNPKSSTIIPRFRYCEFILFMTC